MDILVRNYAKNSNTSSFGSVFYESPFLAAEDCLLAHFYKSLLWRFSQGLQAPHCVFRHWQNYQAIIFFLAIVRVKQIDTNSWEKKK
jgi:hypothetical protein